MFMMKKNKVERKSPNAFIGKTLLCDEVFIVKKQKKYLTPNK